MTESRNTRTRSRREPPSQPANQLVTVVTPSFNQAKFLEETIRSVALQSYRPIQHVVVDGGSTDGSVDILKRCAAEFRGSGYVLDWISEPDRGFADALGKGFAITRGEIVGWLNSDDVYFDRHVVESSIRELVAHPEVDVVHGDVALISETSGLWMIWCFPRFDYKRALRSYIVPQPTLFLRRSVVQRHPIGSLGVVGLDHAYYLEIGRAHKFRHIHRVQAGDRDHAARRTNTMSSQWTEETDQYLKTYGNGYAPTRLDRTHDVLTRLLMRFKGAIYLVRMFAQRNFDDELAFPLWMDSRWKVLRRQFIMRLTRRPDLGPAPVRHRTHPANVVAGERS
jgi:glycosyltransferase involved in cell wall biosynthesis